MGILIRKALKDYYKEKDNVIRLFSEKQKLACSYVLGNIYCFIDEYFFNLEDIIYDLENDCPVGLILQWQDDRLSYNYDMEEMGAETTYINYKSYHMGLRYETFKQ